LFDYTGCTVAVSEKTTCKNRKNDFAARSKLFTHLKIKFMSKKKVEPRKNKPTQKKSSAQKKADPKKKARR
jgi:hypothetical protein